MSISLRQRWNEHGGMHPLSQGVKSGSVVYKGKMAEAFPFDSMRALANGLKWPSRVVPTTRVPHDLPKNFRVDFANRNQGVAHDDKFWYFTTATHIVRVPRKLPFPTSDPDVIVRDHTIDESIIDRAAPLFGLPPFHHMGDPDFYDGLLFVPVEGTNVPHPVLMAFDRELNFMGWAPLLDMPGGGNFPWLAIRNGFMYTSRYNEVGDILSGAPPDIGVRVYKLPPTGAFNGLDRDGMSLRGVFALEAMTRADPVGFFDPERGEIGLLALGRIPLRGRDGGRFPDFVGGGSYFGIMRIQGGAVSQNAHLWLTSWDDDAAPTQLIGIDLLTGQLRSHARIQNSWTQEIEGITALDLGDAGQLHLVLIDNLGVPSLYFKHYEAERLEDRPFV